MLQESQQRFLWYDFRADQTIPWLSLYKAKVCQTFNARSSAQSPICQLKVLSASIAVSLSFLIYEIPNLSFRHLVLYHKPFTYHCSNSKVTDFKRMEKIYNPQVSFGIIFIYHYFHSLLLSPNFFLVNAIALSRQTFLKCFQFHSISIHYPNSVRETKRLLKTNVILSFSSSSMNDLFICQGPQEVMEISV